MDKQLSIFDVADNIDLEYGARGCEACYWYQKTKDGTRACFWNDWFWRNVVDQPCEYPTCGYFEPSDQRIRRMCSTCKWASHCHYETKEQYAAAIKNGNGYSLAAASDPVEEPNIYCTHPQGSLNRRTAYKDREWPGFGVGHWHRQHEWDTCDRYEEYKGRW